MTKKQQSYPRRRRPTSASEQPPGPRPARNRVHGDVQGERGGAYEAVYRCVRRIPRGRVMTYGQVATCIENRLSPRAVGWALHGCPPDVPWHRVVNARGGCSTDRLPDMPTGLQRAMLEAEGVRFDAAGFLDLTRHRWNPGEPAAGKARSCRRKGVPQKAETSRCSPRGRRR